VRIHKVARLNWGGAHLLGYQMRMREERIK
jgi:hypothetical protein